MDAAAHPTKPSTPPYGSPGKLRCISQLCRARRLRRPRGCEPAAPDEAPCSQDTVPRSQDALEPDALEAVLPTPTPATRPKPNALEPYEAAAAKSSSKPAAAKPSKKQS